ncbi:Bacterial capsule synthesis protein PGA_cap [Actinomyces bovis]|uniref:Bacterial capsule synthesis protein PGA_cap n=2 Tax=Actinomyces bovis TaxID=1658 RepID=A0ABY1VQ07_9ACTO|nr:Bacterial capsule synthesis protein PGA_cap [Actinomyces bovis]VEG53322.1 Bacterial capsule synthesis protein PGA_cap [Actinomyces israelii]
MHMPVMEDTPGGSGDISGPVTAAQPWISGVDLALCGMELPVSPDSIPSGYPRFATLPGLLQAVAKVGWDGCATASNHAIDQGEAGVDATIDALTANGLGYAGTNRSEAEAKKPYQLYRLERAGRTITVAELSTTYSLNGLVDETGWKVQLNDVAAIAANAKAARAEGAHVVVLHSQLGEEYSPEPVAEQVEYAKQIAATGEVDVFFGAHPHVPQRAERLEGGPGGKGMWASYSAGNFISNQSEETVGVLTSAIGNFVWVEVTVTPEGTAQVDALHWHPFTVDHYAGHQLRDLGALQRGEFPAGCQISQAEATRRWNSLMGVMDASTYTDTVPQASGSAPVVVRRH